MELYKSNFRAEIENYYKLNGNAVGFKFNSSEQYKIIEQYVIGNYSEIVRQYAAMQIPTIMMNRQKSY